MRQSSLFLSTHSMLRRDRLRLAFITLPILMMSGVTSAATFPDVPEDHIYYEQVTALVDADVIDGNPDGSFYPNRPVNRAELLKMLYRAQGKMPDPSSTRCFPDVIPGSWYESYVCDAAANRLVNGYPDGTFKPGQEVNRVESLKMIMNILGIDVPEISGVQKDVVKFVDVSTAAWYTKYLFAAFAKRILPIAGQEGARFYPDWPLLRGEAAAYIYNALHVSLEEERMESASAASTEAESVEAENGVEPDSKAGEDQEKTDLAVTEIRADVPFEWSGKFSKKRAFTFLFDIETVTTVYVDASLQVTGSLTCRLYKLEEGGFSNEYYLGQQDNDHCYIHAAISPGSYQLQLQPSVADATFRVAVSEKTGDGNDGFREAVTLIPSVAKSSTLEINDLQDWFVFSVKTEKSMKVDLTNSTELDCLVYPGSNVDLFGFSGPQCNQNFPYTPGTYYVSVFRKIASKATKKTYSIQLH